jgi:hypothetical protein
MLLGNPSSMASTVVILLYLWIGSMVACLTFRDVYAAALLMITGFAFEYIITATLMILVTLHILYRIDQKTLTCNHL